MAERTFSISFTVHGAKAVNLTEDEHALLTAMQETPYNSIGEFVEQLDLPRERIIEMLASLSRRGIVTIEFPPEVKNKLN